LTDRPKVVAIVQARMGSTRLPGKALKNLAGRPVAEWVLRRLRRASRVSEVRLAIPETEADAALAELAGRLDLPCTRGDEEDVLGRYLAAAREADADHVVRVTGDCPFTDPAVVDAVIERHLASGADYTSNGNPPEYPRGFEVEVCARAALERAAKEARNPYDREHVTSFLYREEGRFIVEHVAAPPELRRPDLRVCIDTEPDLALANVIAEYFEGRGRFGAREVVEFLATHPMVAAMNRRVEQKARAKIAFWIDYGPKLGTGHLARARALAEALAARGALTRAFYAADAADADAKREEEEVTRVGVERPGPKPRELAEFRLVPLHAQRSTELRQELLEGIEAFEAQCIVVDAYRVGDSDLEALRAAGLAVVAINDLGRAVPANLVVNPNADASAEAYRSLPADVEVLAGVAYFPAREDLVRAARAAREQGKERTAGAPPSRRMLIAFGGSDPEKLTAPVLRAVLSVAPPIEADVVVGPLAADEVREGVRALADKHPEQVSVHSAPDLLADLYARADVAIAAAGIMKYELALFGVPSVLVTVAGNQVGGVEAMARAGACRYLGDVRGAKGLSPARIVLAATALLSDPDARARMAAAGRRLVDGDGAGRCAAAVFKLLEEGA